MFWFHFQMHRAGRVGIILLLDPTSRGMPSRRVDVVSQIFITRPAAAVLGKAAGWHAHPPPVSFGDVGASHAAA